MATPQTLLSVRDVMAGQNMMRLGGGLRRRDVEALPRGVGWGGGVGGAGDD